MGLRVNSDDMEVVITKIELLVKLTRYYFSNHHHAFNILLFKSSATLSIYPFASWLDKQIAKSKEVKIYLIYENNHSNQKTS